MQHVLMLHPFTYKLHYIKIKIFISWFLICYIYITLCYIFLTFKTNFMTKSKKIKNLILSGCLLLWWISLIIFYEWNPFWATFSLCFAGSWMLWTLLIPDSKKQKDEMTKKAWYTALALTAKLYCFILCITFIFDAFFHFIDLISATEALLSSLYLILFLSRGCYTYYLHHPEKTGL